jgi:hypothetical protein
MSSYQAPPRKPTAEDPLVVAAREAGMLVDNAPAPTSNVVSLASARRAPTDDATARILEKYRITLDFSLPRRRGDRIICCKCVRLFLARSCRSLRCKTTSAFWGTAVEKCSL